MRNPPLPGDARGQSRHRYRYLATLGIYVRLGEEITAKNDEHHHRRQRH